MNTENDSQDFLQLILQNKRIIFKICNAYCHGKYDRDDLAQEIVYQLWKSKDRFNTDYAFTTWMYRIALNVAISFYRKERKMKNETGITEHLLEIEDSRESSVESDENMNMLQRFINELRALDRALMILYLEEKTYREMSDILGITETNVATRINRVKNQLKQKFSTIK